MEGKKRMGGNGVEACLLVIHIKLKIQKRWIFRLLVPYWLYILVLLVMTPCSLVGIYFFHLQAACPLKMKALYSFKTSVSKFQTPKCHTQKIILWIFISVGITNLIDYIEELINCRNKGFWQCCIMLRMIGFMDNGQSP
jgi:hypothetical protein